MADFSALITNWYRLNKRDLPWRQHKNPYKIWISEIILQQTQVTQGLNYYLNFVNTYPTIHKLAEAKEKDVLNLWQGLGYYSRARNMLFAAKQIMSDFNGQFPNNYKDLLTLKGVGPYTAAAISSIAFNQPKAVVDGNVFRVLSRVFLIDTPINTPEGLKTFTTLAQSLLDLNNPGDHNQAIMEIGALVCKPKNPDCNQCPLIEVCEGARSKDVLNYPVKIKKINIKKRTIDYLFIKSDQYYYLNKRGKGDIWQGLYDFPLANTFLDSNHIILGQTITHKLTHQHITANFWLINETMVQDKSNLIKLSKSEIDSYPMPQLIVNYINTLH